MNVLIIGGMHGNESLGIELVRLLRRRPIENVGTMIANPRAVRRSVRYTETDLNRSFNGGETYEARRAEYIKRFVTGYDIVIDFHNTEAIGNDCAFVGPDCLPALMDVAGDCGLRRCIIADYDCINKYCNNTISFEISIASPTNNPEYWYEKIAMLAANPLPMLDKDVEVYRYVRRVTWSEKAEYKLRNWRAFAPIKPGQLSVLGLPETSVPIFVGSHLTEYYATIVKKYNMQRAQACITRENMPK